MTDSQVADELSALATAAPESVLPGVLVATGIADSFAPIEGPAGPLYVAWNDHGVSGVAPAADESEFETIHADRVGRPLVRTEAVPERLETRLRRALDTGKLGSLPVDLRRVTPFQRDVLETITRIPAGEVRSYGWVAKEMGRPGATRAVGTALNRNPVPVLIPCHRVGRSDGTLGEYAFGPQMKRDLLEAEGLDVLALEDEAARGVRYVGSDTTHIFCVPTCRNAKRIGERHREEFGSEGEAAEAGYRPCKVCRPARAA